MVNRIKITNKIISLRSKKSSLFPFSASDASGKLKDPMVHWVDGSNIF